MVFVAFMSRVSHVLNSLLAPKQWKPHDQIDTIRQFMKTGIFDHHDEGRFTGAYYFCIDEIQPFMENHGFETLRLIGSTNLGAVFTPEQWGYWRNRGEKEFEKLLDLLIELATDPNISVYRPIYYILAGKKPH